MSLSPLSQVSGVSNSIGLRDLSLVFTSYVGNEERVLLLRNSNRCTPQTREYLDWRYCQLPDMPAPCIAWLISAAGEAVGMAAAIFRPYWMNGTLSHIAVLGDISLAEGLRGRGVGQQLLAGLSRHLRLGSSGGWAFVIPTEAARRSLHSIGWRTAGELLPYVCPINPGLRLKKIMAGNNLVAGLCRPIHSMLLLALRRQLSKGDVIEVVDEFGERFDNLWARVPKTGRIIGDRGRASLVWRYRAHPNRRFRVAQLIRGGELRGFVVFETEETEPEWIIQDIVVVDQSDLPRMLALFLLHCLECGDLAAVRLTLSDQHPYARQLWRLGFIARASRGVFQVLELPHRPSGIEGLWCLTAGDKDI